MKATWKVFQLCRLHGMVYSDMELEDLILNPSSATYLLCRLGQVTSLFQTHTCRLQNVRVEREPVQRVRSSLLGTREALRRCWLHVKSENHSMAVPFLKVCRLAPCNLENKSLIWCLAYVTLLAVIFFCVCLAF